MTSTTMPVYLFNDFKFLPSKGRELYDKGQCFAAVEILNKLVYAEPENTAAKDLLADVFEPIGYQKESPSVRNSFLAAAYELRNHMPGGTPPKTTGPDTIRDMSTELWLNSVVISLDSSKVAGQNFTINLVTPDNKEKFVIELSNSLLTDIQGQLAKQPDLTIAVNRSELEKVMGDTPTFNDLLKECKANVEGDRKPFDALRSALVRFTPNFEMLPGTAPKGKKAPSKQKPFEAHEPADTSGG